MNFNLNWDDYKLGFGELDGEFWFGNEHLHLLTSLKSYTLRVDLEDWDGNTAYAEYSVFSIGSEQDKYRLTVLGYSGTAGEYK